MMTSSNVIPTICVLQHPSFITGWWFGTWLLFCPENGNVIIPTDFHIFQRARYTTNQQVVIYILYNVQCCMGQCLMSHISPPISNFIMSSQYFFLCQNTCFHPNLTSSMPGPRSPVRACAPRDFEEAWMSGSLKLELWLYENAGKMMGKHASYGY